MNVFDPRHVWGNFETQKKFFRSQDNSNYTSYADFIANSKIDSELKEFKYYKPFNFVPSYGSSVTVQFENNEIEYGNKYVSSKPALLNRVAMSFDVNFNDRSDKDANEIIKFLEENENDVFVMQKHEYSELNDDEKFKSLISLDPYFVQEFKCFQFSLTESYRDLNSITANFYNQDFSMLTLKYLLFANSMSEKRKNIFQEYFYKKHLDILPSYSVNSNSTFHTKDYSLGNSRSEYSKDGTFSRTDEISITYEKMTDLDAYKILCLIIGRQGIETFTFNTIKPELRTSKFTCTSIKHDYVYKDTNTLQLNLKEEKIKKNFNI
jgi:hypothetical protein